MFTLNNLYNNKNMVEIMARGDVRVFEYKKDLSISPEYSIIEHYASEMNIRKRQVMIELNNSAYTISASAMQWSTGKVAMVADVKGMGDLLSKALASKVSKESTIKPRYQGTGVLMLEPLIDIFY